MALRDDIYTALTGDATLTTLVGSNIYYQIFPENFNSSNDGLMIKISVADVIRGLGDEGIIFKSYIVNITVASASMDTLYSISDAVEDAIRNNFYLGKYEREDVPTWDEEVGVYALSSEFEIND